MALDARKKRESSRLCRKVSRSPNDDPTIEQTTRGEAMRKHQGMQSQKDSPVQEQRISELGSLELGLFISKLWPASHKIAANAMQIASNGEIVVQKDFPVQSTHV
jgi:hypothetical protein